VWLDTSETLTAQMPFINKNRHIHLPQPSPNPFFQVDVTGVKPNSLLLQQVLSTASGEAHCREKEDLVPAGQAEIHTGSSSGT